MPEYLRDLLFAMFAWWFGTGLVLFLNQLPARTYRWSLSVATAGLLAALYGIGRSCDDASSSGALIAFTEALVVWAWMEMSYFMGFLTGPDKSPCPAGATGWRRFRLALRTSIHHELAVAAAGLLIVWITWDAPNQIGTWTYATLWLMRWSAKLNLFLGVANVHDEWFPPHLSYLSTYIPRKPMNLLFPFSVGVGTIATTLAFAAADSADAMKLTGYVLVGTLLGLGTLEHWFLVLPLRDSLLWQWALKAAGRDPDPGTGMGSEKMASLDPELRDQDRAVSARAAISAG
jgi:putative photosynthetic complex assembly protein 2